MGIDFFQVLAVACERGGYGVARTRAFEQNDMGKRLCVIVSLSVHGTSIGPRLLTANTEKAGKSPILRIRKKWVKDELLTLAFQDVQGRLGLSKGFGGG
jgi:hypothetical protein